MKKVVLIFAFLALFVQSADSQSRTLYDDGFLAGYTYHEMDRRDMYEASLELALEQGQNEYAMGLVDGWMAYTPPNTDPFFLNPLSDRAKVSDFKDMD
ncbi:MAG: hypothetical protein ED557_06365 [Balneola sp.]|nr:MAG: hypothetical protein ED557_06365 [Balneola sp.]